MSRRPVDKDKLIIWLDNQVAELVKRNKLVRRQTNRVKDKMYSLIQKKPDYFYSFSGHYLFRKWIRMNGITFKEAEVLIILSFYKCLFQRELRYWGFHLLRYEVIFGRLIEIGYVARVEIPGQAFRKRKGYVLTPKGQLLEADYERYWDKQSYGMKFSKYTDESPVVQEDAEFRRIFIPKKDRRGVLHPGVREMFYDRPCNDQT